MVDRVKACNDCGVLFDRGKSHAPRCKICRREWERNWRLRRKAAGNRVVSTPNPPNYYLVRKRVYYSRPEIKARMARVMREYSRRPEVAPKVRARTAVNHAIKSGILKREPCFCGETRTQAHHDDYAKPLDVRWLCLKHHREVHAQAEAAAKGDNG